MIRRVCLDQKKMRGLTVSGKQTDSPFLQQSSGKPMKIRQKAVGYICESSYQDRRLRNLDFQLPASRNDRKWCPL